MFNLLKVVGIIILTVFVFVYFYQEKLIFHPQKTSHDFQYTFKTNFKERVFSSKAQNRLHALQFTKPHPKGVILYFHGNAGNLEDWGQIYHDFKTYNLDLIIVDYAGFGKSSSKIKNESSFFKDAKSIYEQVKAEFKEENIILYGRSIGSAAASYLSAKNSPQLVILETPFYSLKSLAKSIFPLLPSFLLKYKFESYKYLKQATAPIYIIHGTQDQLIPLTNATRLKEVTKKTQFYTINNGGHNNLNQFEDYHKIIKNVLGKL